LSGKQKEEALAQKEREFRDLILRAYKAQPLEGESFFHGKNAGRLVVVGPINLPVGRLFVEEVITECRKRGASRVDVLAFEFEMGLFPAVLDERCKRERPRAQDILPGSTTNAPTKARCFDTVLRRSYAALRQENKLIQIELTICHC
jgi:site-specific DNA-methyltransferase (adenine-specific)/adenine-specific DNA-methyltransferase